MKRGIIPVVVGCAIGLMLMGAVSGCGQKKAEVKGSGTSTTAGKPVTEKSRCLICGKDGETYPVASDKNTRQMYLICTPASNGVGCAMAWDKFGMKLGSDYIVDKDNYLVDVKTGKRLTQAEIDAITGPRQTK